MNKVLRILFVAVLVISLPPHLWGAEIGASVSSSTFGFTKDGSLDPDDPLFGFSFFVRDSLTDFLDGTISFERDPVTGNLVSARASYKTTFLSISAGPSFGVLNTPDGDDGVTNLIQPGLALGFSVIIPGIFVARADSDFALPQMTGHNGQVFIQRGLLSLGFFLPNVLCSLNIHQRSTVEYLSNGLSATRSITDWGLYTESSMKGSPFRVSVDFIYRVLEYYEGTDSPENREFASLVLGGGLTWVPKADMSFFILGSGSLYTFSLEEAEDDLDRFLFEIKIGTRIMTGNQAGHR